MTSYKKISENDQFRAFILSPHNPKSDFFPLNQLIKKFWPKSVLYHIASLKGLPRNSYIELILMLLISFCPEKNAYYICGIYSNALQTKFITEANTMNPDQTAQKEGFILFAV